MENTAINTNPTGKMGNFRRVLRYTIAIIAALLLIIILIEGCRFYNLSPDKLYAEKFTSYQLSGDSEQYSSSIADHYGKKDYSAVVNVVLNRPPTPHEALLRGLSYLETGDPSRAVIALQAGVNSHDTARLALVKDQLQFYLSLAYVRNRDYDQAIELMNEINSNTSHTYAKRLNAKYIRRVKMLKWR
jgi:hypothetical protein